MPQLNLSTLNGPELRRLLDSARRRGEAALSYQILQEMAARRDGDSERRRLFRMREPEGSRMVELNLGDPMEPQDDIPPAPTWRPPEPVAAAAPEPPPQRAPRRRKATPPPEPVAVVEDPLPPLELTPAADEALEADELRFAPPPLDRPAAPRPRRLGLAAAFVVGAAAGIVAGWGLSEFNRPAPVSTAAARPVETVLAQQTAPAPAAVPVVVEPQPAPEPPVEAAPVMPAATEEGAASPDTEAADASGEALELPPPPRKAEVVTSAGNDACAAEPTPADREICADPGLQRLQKELRRAYAEALDAHEDRARLRERQLAWRDARDGVSDPRKLARLYEARIRKLNAATAEARQLR